MLFSFFLCPLRTVAVCSFDLPILSFPPSIPHCICTQNHSLPSFERESPCTKNSNLFPPPQNLRSLLMIPVRTLMLDPDTTTSSSQESSRSHAQIVAIYRMKSYGTLKGRRSRERERESKKREIIGKARHQREHLRMARALSTQSIPNAEHAPTHPSMLGINQRSSAATTPDPRSPYQAL